MNRVLFDSDYELVQDLVQRKAVPNHARRRRSMGQPPKDEWRGPRAPHAGEAGPRHRVAPGE